MSVRQLPHRPRPQLYWRTLFARPKSANEAGLTLVECIMALVVIGLTGAAIAPMMLVSVATRVQSQKADQALELAQGEVDRVRVQFEQGRANLTNLPAIVTVAGDRAPSIAGPTSLADATIPISEVDVNNDGTLDFAVQSFLVEKTGVADTYEMGVRVYDHDAVENNSGGSLPVDEARLGMTSSQGDRSEKPLAVLYTGVSITEDTTSLCNLIDYTKGSTTVTKPPSCP